MAEKTLYVENGLVYELANESMNSKLAALHKNNFPPEENIAMQFGDGFIKKTYEWFLKSNNGFIIVARDAVTGELAGATTVSLMPYNLQILKYGCLQALLGLIRKPSLLLNEELHIRLKKNLFYPKRKEESNNRNAQIAFTMVNPNFRQKGVGTRFRLLTIETLKSLGISVVVVGVRPINHKAIALNKKLGFKEVLELRTKSLKTMRLEL